MLWLLHLLLPLLLSLLLLQLLQLLLLLSLLLQCLLCELLLGLLLAQQCLTVLLQVTVALGRGARRWRAPLRLRCRDAAVRRHGRGRLGWQRGRSDRAYWLAGAQRLQLHGTQRLAAIGLDGRLLLLIARKRWRRLAMHDDRTARDQRRRGPDAIQAQLTEHARTLGHDARHARHRGRGLKLRRRVGPMA